MVYSYEVVVFLLIASGVGFLLAGTIRSRKNYESRIDSLPEMVAKSYLSASPGDTLILTCESHLSPEQRKRMTEAFIAAEKKYKLKFLILERQMKISGLIKFDEKCSASGDDQGDNPSPFNPEKSYDGSSILR
jgi:hypothetical protein